METENINSTSESNDLVYPNPKNLDILQTQNASTSLIYVSQQNLAPVLQHLQNQQMLVFESLARQHNSSLVKIIIWIVLSILFAVVAIAGMIYWYLQYTDSTQKNITQNLNQYQQNLNHQFSQKVNELQQNYQQDVEQIQTKTQYTYQQLLGFFQKLQQDYQQQMAIEENRKVNLLQRQEILEKTIRELTTNLTTAEITILNLREENRTLQEKQAQLQKLVEKQKEEILQMKKRMAEKLTPEELEKIKQDRQNDG